MPPVKIDFAKGNGLVPVIVQDYQSREVLMVAYMNEEAWGKTLETGKAHYYSRSRKGPWFKGEESGNFQEIKDAFIDCDTDTIGLPLAGKSRTEPRGTADHQIAPRAVSRAGAAGARTA